MTISVEIADRQYDFTDEDVAAEAVAQFQEETNLTDDQIISLWGDDTDIRRQALETLIIAAIDKNGSAKRAAETIPTGITLCLADTST